MRISPTRATDDALEVVFALDPGDPARTSDIPGLVDGVCEVAPGLRRHRCTSPGSGFLISELADTEIAHLFEHLTLELLAQGGAPRTIAGRTDWDFARDGRGVYRVRFEHVDPEQAEQSAAEALAVLQRLTTV